MTSTSTLTEVDATVLSIINTVKGLVEVHDIPTAFAALPVIMSYVEKASKLSNLDGTTKKAVATRVLQDVCKGNGTLACAMNELAPVAIDVLIDAANGVYKLESKLCGSRKLCCFN